MINIIDLNQKITVKWSTRNKKRYVDLGYNFTKISDEFEIKLKDLNKDSSKEVVVMCDICGTKMMTPYRNYNKIIKKSGMYKCRKCNSPFVSEIRINNNADRAIRLFDKLTSTLGYQSIASISDYHGYNTPMSFICPEHGQQELSITQLRNGTICPVCSYEFRKERNKLSCGQVSEKIASKNNDVLINPEDYINYHTDNLKIKCGSCGHVFISSLSSIMNSGGRCPNCGLISQRKSSKASEDAVIDSATVDGECFLINPEDYVNALTKNLYFKCTSCGEVFLQSLQHFKNGYTKCPKCASRISLGESKIMDELDKRGIRYISQKTFKDCRDQRGLPFDFYLDDYNCCVEFDGYQHYHMLQRDTKQSFEKRKFHDSIKTKYCENNDIHLIRIPYWEYQNINQILNKELKVMQSKDIV